MSNFKKVPYIDIKGTFFDTVKKDEKGIWENDQIGTDEKLIMLLAALPETSRDIDFSLQ